MTVTDIGSAPVWPLPAAVVADPWSGEAERALSRLDWSAALCVQVGDPDLWYPEKGGSVREPIKVCQGCPLRAACLALALIEGDREGIWGGVSSMHRRPLQHAVKAGTPLDQVVAAGLARGQKRGAAAERACRPAGVAA